MDRFYDDGTLVIIDSSKLLGAQILVRFIRKWKERKYMSDEQRLEMKQKEKENLLGRITILAVDRNKNIVKEQ